MGAFGGAADEEHVPEGDDDGGAGEEGAPSPVDEESRALELWGEDGGAEDHHEGAGEEEDCADDAEGVLPAGDGQLVVVGAHVLDGRRIRRATAENLRVRFDYAPRRLTPAATAAITR